MVGPDWPCMLVTYSLVVGGGYGVLVGVIERLRWSEAMGAIQWALIIATTLCFSLAGCSEPGIVFRELFDEVVVVHTGEDAEEGLKRIPKKIKCSQCDVHRLPSASHCYDCDLCVSDLDHHCPWTGKCIGKKNLFYFYCFLTSLSALVVYSAAAGIMYAFGLGVREGEGIGARTEPEAGGNGTRV